MADPEASAAQEPTAAEIALQIAANPGLRARFFEDPTATVADAVPAERFGLGVDRDTTRLRRQVLAEVSKLLRKTPETESSSHAEAVMRQFFKEAIRNPELSFMSILGLSLATFAVGAALVVAGLVIVSVGDESTRNAVIAGVFAGSGVVGAIGSVYTLARRGVSVANCDHAQIRLVLSGFATELGHLRSLHLESRRDVNAVNEKIGEAVSRAVDLIQTRVKMVPAGGEPQGCEQVGVPSGQKEGSEGGS
jgi:hypothetical protein